MSENVRYLADQNISIRTVALLQGSGYDIRRSSDFLPPHTSDSRIIEFARTEDWTIITQDLDYSALLADSRHDRPSLVSVRLHDNRPHSLAEVLGRILPTVEADLQEGAIIVVEESRIRIRRLPLS